MPKGKIVEKIINKYKKSKIPFIKIEKFNFK